MNNEELTNKYNSICLQGMQSEIEKIIREKENTKVEKEKIIANEKKLKTENKKLNDILMRYRNLKKKSKCH